MNPTPEHEIFQLVYGYAKIYPSMTKLFTFRQPVKVRKPGYEPRTIDYTKRKSEYVNPMSLIDSLRRTKTKISDIVISNKFDLFCTFTFNCSFCPPNTKGEVCKNEPCVCDPDQCKRHDIEFVKHLMSRWLKNEYRYVGEFKYLIVPEFHKDGKSIHFHALLKGYQGTLVPTTHKRKDGREVYNISNYQHGFSTATKIDLEGVPKVASYVKKYITKDMPQFRGKKRYWCSHGLTRPEKVQNPLVFPYQRAKFTEQYEMKNNMLLQVANEKIDLISKSVH